MFSFLRRRARSDSREVGESIFLDDTAVAQTSLKRRGRGWWGRIILFIPVLIALVPFAWRAYVLHGVYEIPIPFDVEEFCRDKTIPGQNAFDHYVPAIEAAATRGWKKYDLRQKFEDGWPDHEVLENLLRENRDVLEKWRTGTECEAARDVDPQTLTFDRFQSEPFLLRQLVCLAEGQAALLQVEEDFDEALDWHLAAYRCSRHLGWTGGSLERMLGMSSHAISTTGVRRWAAHPNTTPDQLRRARLAMIDVHQRTPPLSEALKAELMTLENSLRQPGQEHFKKRKFLRTLLARASSWLLAKPELLLRINRQLIANQLPEIDKPLHLGVVKQ